MSVAEGGNLKEVGKLQERYRILAKLGSGGMADVFLAVQLGEESFQRLVVVKRVHAMWLENQNAMKMFIAEARTISQLNHPHIVQIYDLSRLGKDICITMEYINGENLDYVRKAVLKNQQTIPLPIVCKMMVEACEALNYAHHAKTPEGKTLNLIHRDVGPHNLMMDTSGYLKVIDFGIAKSSARSDMTTPGMIKGKFSYLAPDLFKFDKIDGRIDLYALGLVFREMLTLRRCFDFKKDVTVAEVLKRVTTEELVPPSKLAPHVPKKLDALIAKAIHKDRDRRFQTCEEFAAEIKSFAEKHDGLASSADVEKWYRDQFPERIDKRREFEKKALAKAKTLAERDSELDPSETTPGLSGSGVFQTANISGITGASQFQVQAQSPTSLAEQKRTNPYIFVVVFFILFAGAAVLVHQLFFKREQVDSKADALPAIVKNLIVKSEHTDAEVLLDGQMVGYTGSGGLKLRLDPERSHALIVRKAGFESYAIELKGERNGVRTLDAQLEQTQAAPDGGQAGADQTRIAMGNPPDEHKPGHMNRRIKKVRPGPGKHGVKGGPGVKVPGDRRAPDSGKGHSTPKDVSPPEVKPLDLSEDPKPPPVKDMPVRVKPDPRVADRPNAKNDKEVPAIIVPIIAQPVDVALAPKADQSEYYSGDGSWSGVQVAQRGCTRCHDGSKAKKLDWNSKSKRLWKKFFLRKRHKKHGKLSKYFSKGEIRRVSGFIQQQVKEDQKSGIAGVK